MASISKRTARSWKVSVEPAELERISALKSSGLASQALQAFQALPQRLDRTFSDQRDAEGLAAHYRSLGIEGVTVRRRSTLAWQVRIRIIGAPSLTETFPNKAMAEQWAREREGEIAKRSFVDYREAERKSLADLLLQYDRDKRGHRAKDDPDRVRLRVIAAQPVAAIRMSLLQPSDLCAYRDWRLKGADGIPPVKGTTVKKELELMCRVIGLAMREWNIHLAFNPASAERVARPAPEPGDERDRRLEPVFVPLEALQAQGQGSGAPSKRRVNPDSEFERDPEIDELLSMPQTEQQALLRALRYAHWFTQVRKSTNAATLRRRAAKGAQAPVKASRRSGGRNWVIFSFAIETAMRRGELCKLRWRDVKLSEGYMLLPGRITKNRKERIVPLTLRARRILLTRPRVSELVFDTTANAIKCAFRRARERVGIVGLRTHDLRHEATSRLFEQTDLRANEIGHITGHTDPRMLERYYNKRPAELVKRFRESRR